MRLSENGHLLLWQGECSVPVVTVENYEKWYSLYVVHPDGQIQKVPAAVIEEVTKGQMQLWIDHEFHPHLLLLVAKHYEGEAHGTALEMAAGRWVMADHGLGTPMAYFLDEPEEFHKLDFSGFVPLPASWLPATAPISEEIDSCWDGVKLSAVRALQALTEVCEKLCTPVAQTRAHQVLTQFSNDELCDVKTMARAIAFIDSTKSRREAYSFLDHYTDIRPQMADHLSCSRSEFEAWLDHTA